MEVQKENTKEENEKEKENEKEEETKWIKQVEPEKKSRLWASPWFVSIMIALIGVAAHFALKAMTKKEEDKLREEMKSQNVVNDSELAELRILNELYEEDTLKLLFTLIKEGREEDEFTFEEMEEKLYLTTGKRFLKTFLFERALEYHIKYFGGERMKVEDWMLFMAMLTCATEKHRHALVFEILDRNQTDLIDRNQLRKYLKYAVEMGWAFDSQLIEQTQFIPPKFAPKDFETLIQELEQKIIHWKPAPVVVPKTKLQKLADFMGYQNENTPSSSSSSSSTDIPISSPSSENDSLNQVQVEKKEKKMKEKIEETIANLFGTLNPFKPNALTPEEQKKNHVKETEIAEEYLDDLPVIEVEPEEHISMHDLLEKAQTVHGESLEEQFPLAEGNQTSKSMHDLLVEAQDPRKQEDKTVIDEKLVFDDQEKIESNETNFNQQDENQPMEDLSKDIPTLQNLSSEQKISSEDSIQVLHERNSEELFPSSIEHSLQSSESKNISEPEEATKTPVIEVESEEHISMHDLLEKAQTVHGESLEEQFPLAEGNQTSKSMHDLLVEAQDPKEDKKLTTRLKSDGSELGLEEKDKFHSEKLNQLQGGMTLTKFVHMPFEFR